MVGKHGETPDMGKLELMSGALFVVYHISKNQAGYSMGILHLFEKKFVSWSSVSEF